MELKYSVYHPVTGKPIMDFFLHNPPRGMQLDKPVRKEEFKKRAKVILNFKMAFSDEYMINGKFAMTNPESLKILALMQEIFITDFECGLISFDISRLEYPGKESFKAIVDQIDERRKQVFTPEIYDFIAAKEIEKGTKLAQQGKEFI